MTALSFHFVISVKIINNEEFFKIMKSNNALKLLLSVVMCLAVGFFGGLFTSSSATTWYVTLNKPSFNPPSWLFAPVWTVLYVLIGISFYVIWKKGIDKKELAFFFAQLGLNFVWSLLFFGLKIPWVAFVDIVLLWVFILLTILAFYKKDKVASWLLLPYLLWVAFASVLNFAIAYMN